MDQSVYKHIQELQQAAYFRIPTHGDYSRIVNSPYLGGPIASAFERPSRFEDPAIEMGRLGFHEVHNIIWGVDVVEDTLEVLDKIPGWAREGAVNVRSMAGGRC